MFKIKLMENNSSLGAVEGIDPVSAVMEMDAANEELNVVSLQHSILVTAVENIEDGSNAAEAIAARGDVGAGVVVARESLRQNLKMIGQEALVSSVVSAGTESVEVANEGIADMAKKAWAKAKEFMLKIWDFIVSLTRKVVQFVASLFGKGATTSERLKKLIKSLKDSKRKELDGEFTEAQRKAICKKFALLAASDDGVNVSSITSAYTSLTSAFENATNEDKINELIEIGNAGVDRQFVAENPGRIAVVNAKLKGFYDRLNNNPFSNNDVVDLDNNTITENGIVRVVTDKFTDEYEHNGYRIYVVGLTFTKVHCVAFYADEDADEKRRELNEAVGELGNREVDASKANAIFNKVLSYLRMLKVVQFTVAPEESDYEDAEKDVYPLSFGDLETIQTACKSAEKDVKGKLEKFEKNIDKKAKEFKKNIEDRAKNATLAHGSDNAKAVGKQTINALGDIAKLILEKETKLAKAFAQTAVDMAKDITAGPVYDYAEMSSKYYKKG